MINENKIRLFFIEDDKVDRMAFERLVKTEHLPYEYKVAESVSEAAKILASESFDVVITDLRLGDGSAFDLFPLIKDIPFIVVTGSGDEKFAVKAMKAGAHEYLIKDLERNYLHLLPLTVEEAIKHHRTEKELKEKEIYIRSIHENVSSGIITMNNEGLIESFNPSAERIFGYKAQEVTGRSLDMLLPHLLLSDDSSFGRYLEEGKIRIIDKGFETIALRKDHSVFPVEFSISEMWLERRDVFNVFIVTVNDISERNNLETLLREQAMRDGLTGLFNKRAMQSILNDELNRTSRYSRVFSLLMFDIDFFKNVNDTYGHKAGDDVLREMSHLIQNNLRLTDKAIRYGGEEFLVILSETNTDNAAILAERLRLIIGSYPFMIEDNTGQSLNINITISIGVAGFPYHGNSEEALIAAADKALYQAKEQGRNRVVKA